MQSRNSKSFFYKAYNPVLQAGVIFGVMFSLLVLSKVANWVGMADFQDRFPWIIAASFLLFYVIFNSIFSLSSRDLNQYWVRSILSYVSLSVASGLMAYLFSMVTFGEAGTIKWIFIVLTIVYLVFLSIVRFMKNIVEFAEREEWHQPKKRKGKKRR